MNKLLVERIKKLRMDSELSQAKIAVIFGVAQSTVAAWEVGRNEPDSEMLIRLATYFDVTVDYLIGKTNNFYHDEQNNKIRQALLSNHRLSEDDDTPKTRTRHEIMSELKKDDELIRVPIAAYSGRKIDVRLTQKDINTVQKHLEDAAEPEE